MCVSPNSNTVFPCKISNTNIKVTKITTQCGNFQFWIHMKCNNLNYIHYNYFQGSSDPWFCISFCKGIFLFRISTNKNQSMMSNCNPTAIKIVKLLLNSYAVLWVWNLLQIYLFYSTSLISLLLSTEWS